ncbi:MULTISPECIES: hypothetical protein [unclassified Novosphingobium]|uniref:hypothetical protein n=1 Tax=unclassified Novosphingobium TaxID=2644732 RepID=UPI001358F07B|nr:MULTISPECIES: hypothetical protein [unclassified Novosphingobium]
MRAYLVIVAVTADLFAGAGAQAAGTPTTATAPNTSLAAPRYTAKDRYVGTLLDDPEAKAILAKHIPDIIRSEQIDMARSMTLKVIQQYSADQITDAKLAAIDADLTKLPPKK